MAGEVIALYGRLNKAQQKVVAGELNDPVRITNLVQYNVQQSKEIKDQLYQLSLKIEGRGEGE